LYITSITFRPPCLCH